MSLVLLFEEQDLLTGKVHFFCDNGFLHFKSFYASTEMFPIAGLTLEKFSLRTCQNADTKYLLFFESLFMPFMKTLR